MAKPAEPVQPASPAVAEGGAGKGSEYNGKGGFKAGNTYGSRGGGGAPASTPARPAVRPGAPGDSRNHPSTDVQAVKSHHIAALKQHGDALRGLAAKTDTLRTDIAIHRNKIELKDREISHHLGKLGVRINAAKDKLSDIEKIAKSGDSQDEKLAALLAEARGLKDAKAAQSQRDALASKLRARDNVPIARKPSVAPPKAAPAPETNPAVIRAKAELARRAEARANNPPSMEHRVKASANTASAVRHDRTVKHLQSLRSGTHRGAPDVHIDRLSTGVSGPELSRAATEAGIPLKSSSKKGMISELKSAHKKSRFRPSKR